MIKWFSKHAVCADCGVHFKPVKSLYGNFLCPTHRAPAEEKQARYERVVSWANDNWERLEEQMLLEKKVAQKAAQEAGFFAAWSPDHMEHMANQVMAQQQTSGGNHISGVANGGYGYSLGPIRPTFRTDKQQ